jgi:hypothetical protein
MRASAFRIEKVMAFVGVAAATVIIAPMTKGGPD